MRNVTELIPDNEEWRTKAAVLLNYCHSVVRPECEQLKTAMAEYSASLKFYSGSRTA